VEALQHTLLAATLGKMVDLVVEAVLVQRLIIKWLELVLQDKEIMVELETFHIQSFLEEAVAEPALRDLTVLQELQA
jgi:hypothetical protein